jgi:hypothetical protein
MSILFILAQAAAPAMAAPQPPQQAIVSYGPEFFAALRPNTALDMVQRLPGFSLDTGSSVRGFEGAAGNVLIDGQRPSSKTDGVDQLLVRLPAGQVARIDLIRGGAPGIDMQGKTVIANVIRKPGGGAHGVFAYADQSADNGQHAWALRIEGSGRIGPRSWEAGLFAGHFFDDGDGDGPRTRLDGAGKPLLLGDIHVHGFAGQFILTGAMESPLAGGQLRVNGRMFWNPYDQNDTDFIRAPNVHQETEHDDDNVRSSELGARYSHPWGGRATTELVTLRQDKDEKIAADFRAPGDAELFQLDNRTAETIARGVIKFQQTATLSWEAGAEGAYNTLTSQTRFSLNGAAVALPAANVTVEEKRGELFGKGVWRPTPTITVEGGVREEGSRISSSGDVSLQKSLYFTKPRVALTWAPDTDDQVRVRYERVVGQLDFGAFVASQNLAAGTLTAGNPNLEPEKDWVGELAYERHFWNGGAVILAGRHFEITDVVDRAPFGAFDAPANIGAGAKDEEELTLTLPLDKLRLKGAQIRGDVTWRQSTVTDPTTHRQRDITALHPVDWNAHFTQDLPNLRLNWGVDLYGGWRERYFRFDQIQTTKAGTYVTPFLEWKPRRDFSLRFEWDNATGRGLKRTLEQFAGSRATSPLSFVENRDPHFGQIYYVRLRKTFGS